MQKVFFRKIGVKSYKPGKSIEELQRELGFEDAIKLASNENPLGPPSSAVDIIQKKGHAMAYKMPDSRSIDIDTNLDLIKYNPHDPIQSRK